LQFLRRGLMCNNLSSADPLHVRASSAPGHPMMPVMPIVNAKAKEPAVQTPTNVPVDGRSRHVDTNRARHWKCRKGPPWMTNCPVPAWVNSMVRTDPNPGKTVVVIGCNKGNDAIRWMELWDASSVRFWSQRRWTKYIDKHLPHRPYACVDTYRYVKTSIVDYEVKATRVPIGVCVEPMPGNVKLLKSASAALGYNSRTLYGSFHIVAAAVTSSAAQNQTVPFPDGPPGMEKFSIGYSRKRVNYTMVPVTTVDGIMESLGLQRAEILLIDTEGFDAEVLKGAKRTLAQVRYLEFEVHRDLSGTPWNTTSLKSVALDLQQQGFDCFWAGNDGRLTHILDCWHSTFESGAWANVACVKKDDVWSSCLQRYAV